MDLADFDIVIVGSGFFGSTIAHKSASELALKVCVLERRGHFGGNSFSERDGETGIECHKYGTHIFHTSNSDTLNFIRRFTEFNDYRHRVWTKYRGRTYSMPINLGTICTFFGKSFTPDEAKRLIADQAKDRIGNDSPANLEEKAISLIGRPLYEAFIRGYTFKQWQTNPLDLPADIITRLPVRFTFDDRYFSDKFEGIPIDGYGRIFSRMLAHPNIEVRLNVDFFDVGFTPKSHQLLIYTGPVDRYFNYSAGTLKWRTIDLERESIATADFQGTSVMNYADDDIPYTRIHEFKHLHPERKHSSDKTVIFREYSRFATPADEPYYPINTKEDQRVYDAYREMTRSVPNSIFGGRLGTYRYLDMHQAIAAAHKSYENQVRPYFMESRNLSSSVAASRSFRGMEEEKRVGVSMASR